MTVVISFSFLSCLSKLTYCWPQICSQLISLFAVIYEVHFVHWLLSFYLTLFISVYYHSTDLLSQNLWIYINVFSQFRSSNSQTKMFDFYQYPPFQPRTSPYSHPSVVSSFSIYHTLFSLYFTFIYLYLVFYCFSSILYWKELRRVSKILDWVW